MDFHQKTQGLGQQYFFIRLLGCHFFQPG